jgi:hypothetical protein
MKRCGVRYRNQGLGLEERRKIDERLVEWEGYWLLSERCLLPAAGCPCGKAAAGCRSPRGSVAVLGGDFVEGETGDGFDPGG